MIAPDSNYWYNSIQERFGHKVAQAITSLAQGVPEAEKETFLNKVSFMFYAIFYAILAILIYKIIF